MGYSRKLWVNEALNRWTLGVADVVADVYLSFQLFNCSIYFGVPMYEYTHIYMIIHVEERNHFEKCLEQLFDLEVQTNTCTNNALFYNQL